ncbi:hypothetical protein FH972_013575 [Carpinus fangiana]|uniref:Uncharacterized protein n=1 Tax=Carpinus fangiana TaxID=176857 RepID=A0A5N6R765_9ROSI|nr:hypothetical protein FH972_013575 [Carpinus fangiana]
MSPAPRLCIRKSEFLEPGEELADEDSVLSSGGFEIWENSRRSELAEPIPPIWEGFCLGASIPSSPVRTPIPVDLVEKPPLLLRLHQRVLHRGFALVSRNRFAWI